MFWTPCTADRKLLYGKLIWIFCLQIENKCLFSLASILFLDCTCNIVYLVQPQCNSLSVQMVKKGFSADTLVGQRNCLWSRQHSPLSWRFQFHSHGKLSFSVLQKPETCFGAHASEISQWCLWKNSLFSLRRL